MTTDKSGLIPPEEVLSTWRILLCLLLETSSDGLVRVL